jgi:ABC-type Fe3+ transport system permease subunit
VTTKVGKASERDGDERRETRFFFFFVFLFVVVAVAVAVVYYSFLSSYPEEDQSNKTGCNKSRQRIEADLPSGAARFRRQFFILHHFVG